MSKQCNKIFSWQYHMVPLQLTCIVKGEQYMYPQNSSRSKLSLPVKTNNVFVRRWQYCEPSLLGMQFRKPWLIALLFCSNIWATALSKQKCHLSPYEGWRWWRWSMHRDVETMYAQLGNCIVNDLALKLFDVLRRYFKIWIPCRSRQTRTLTTRQQQKSSQPAARLNLKGSSTLLQWDALRIQHPTRFVFGKFRGGLYAFPFFSWHSAALSWCKPPAE